MTLKKLIIFLLVCLGILLWMNRQKQEEISTFYQIHRSSDYQVHLKENSFYQEKALPSHQYYVTEAIDSLEFQFQYQYQQEKLEKLFYRYRIRLELIVLARDKDQKAQEIWKRSIPLTENFEKEQTGNSYTIEETVLIPLKQYQDLVSMYEKKYHLSVRGLLKVFLEVEAKGKTDTIEVEIPITDTIMTVSENYEEESVSLNQEKEKKNSLILYLLPLPFILLFFLPRKKKRSTQERYQKNLKRVLKEYRTFLIAILDKPPIENLKEISLTKMEDLVNIAEETNSPILYYQEKQKTTFYLLFHDFVYCYTISMESKQGTL